MVLEPLDYDLLKPLRKRGEPLESKQQKFYGKVKDFYELDTIEDAKRFYAAFIQLNKIHTIDKADKIDKMLTHMYAGKKLTD